MLKAPCFQLQRPWGDLPTAAADGLSASLGQLQTPNWDSLVPDLLHNPLTLLLLRAKVSTLAFPCSCLLLQVGACIVDQNHVIIGIGYNGFPRGCPDGVLPWSKKAHDGDMLGTKYP